MSECTFLLQESNAGGIFNTLSRRASLSRRPSHRGVTFEEAPPAYPSIADGQSFNLDDVSDSDDDDDAFISEAPPNYLDVIASPTTR